MSILRCFGTQATAARSTNKVQQVQSRKLYNLLTTMAKRSFRIEEQSKELVEGRGSKYTNFSLQCQLLDKSGKTQKLLCCTMPEPSNSRWDDEMTAKTRSQKSNPLIIMKGMHMVPDNNHNHHQDNHDDDNDERHAKEDNNFSLSNSETIEHVNLNKDTMMDSVRGEEATRDVLSTTVITAPRLSKPTSLIEGRKVL
jgi:hypothetical protein